MKNEKSLFLIIFLLTILIFNAEPLFSENGDSLSFSNKFFTISLDKKTKKMNSIKLKVKKFNDDFLELGEKVPNENNNLQLKFKIFNKDKFVIFDDSKENYEIKREKLNGGIEEIQLFTEFSKKVKVSSSKTEEIEFNLEVKKVYQIKEDSHKVNYRIVIRNKSKFPISIKSLTGNNGMELGFISMLSKKTNDDYAFVKKDGKFRTLLLGKKKIDKKWSGDISYAGIMDKYYVSLLKFKSIKPEFISIKSFQNSKFNKKIGFPSNIKIVFPSIRLEANEVKSYDFMFFVSQKSYKLLESYDLQEISQLNFLSLFIIKILFFLYDLVHSWGLAIILLTLGIKILLHPLTMKQTTSMKQMQKIQPLMKEIQKKYKDNPTKMNEEVMKLYRENGVNPLSGCLPLVIQIPILIALFTSLRNSIELRGESFLWIKDLSGADPYYILPILIVITMHYQQKQMNTDPNQAAAMKFMPIFMLFICLSLPSGVLVYWVVSNVLQIFQQGYEPASSKKEIELKPNKK